MDIRKSPCDPQSSEAYNLLYGTYSVDVFFDCLKCKIDICSLNPIKWESYLKQVIMHAIVRYPFVVALSSWVDSFLFLQVQEWQRGAFSTCKCTLVRKFWKNSRVIMPCDFPVKGVKDWCYIYRDDCAFVCTLRPCQL